LATPKKSKRALDFESDEEGDSVIKSVDEGESGKKQEVSEKKESDAVKNGDKETGMSRSRRVLKKIGIKGYFIFEGSVFNKH